MSSEAAKKAWATRRARGFVAKGPSRARASSGRRRVKSSFKPFAYQSHSQFWATPKYKGPVIKGAKFARRVRRRR